MLYCHLQKLFLFNSYLLLPKCKQALKSVVFSASILQNHIKIVDLALSALRQLLFRVSYTHVDALVAVQKVMNSFPGTP